MALTELETEDPQDFFAKNDDTTMSRATRNQRSGEATSSRDHITSSESWPRMTNDVTAGRQKTNRKGTTSSHSSNTKGRNPVEEDSGNEVRQLHVP